MNLKIKLFHLIILQLFKLPELLLFFKNLLCHLVFLTAIFALSQMFQQFFHPSMPSHIPRDSQHFQRSVCLYRVGIWGQFHRVGTVVMVTSWAEWEAAPGIDSCKSSAVYHTGKMETCRNSLLCLKRIFSMFHCYLKYMYLPFPQYTGYGEMNNRNCSSTEK